MPTKYPRLSVVMEPPLYYGVKRLARQDGVSLSLKARDLLREALETYEDIYWTEKAERRAATFQKKKGITLKEARKKLGIK